MLRSPLLPLTGGVLVFTMALLLTAPFSEGRDVSDSELALVRGGYVIDNACCVPEAECQDASTDNFCSTYGVGDCDVKVYDAEQGGDNDECVIKLPEWGAYECEMTTPYLCIVIHECYWDGELEICRINYTGRYGWEKCYDTCPQTPNPPPP